MIRSLDMTDDNGDLIKAPVSIALTTTDQGLTADGVIIRDSASVAKGQTGRQVYAKLTKRGPIALTARMLAWKQPFI